MELKLAVWPLMIFTVFALSGCTSIASRGIEWMFSDPRTKNHAYYTEVDLSFTVNGTLVTARRYGEVQYLTGSGGSNFPPCDKGKATCWSMTGHYFVTMKNDDVFDIFINTADLPLSNMPVREVFHLKAHYVSIYRDQADGKDASWCRQLPESIEKHNYGLPPRSHGFAPNIDIDATVVRLDAKEDHGEITEPGDVYRGFSFDHDSCRRLIREGAIATVFQ